MFGAVERPTHASTDADLAQYEVPGHRWADLSEPGFGVSLLSDARYGFSTFGTVMGLSLVRGSSSPDPTADIGEHRFRYALFPHAGDWRAAGTVRRAASFNRPALWTRGEIPACPGDAIGPGDTGRRGHRHHQAGRRRRRLGGQDLRDLPAGGRERASTSPSRCAKPSSATRWRIASRRCLWRAARSNWTCEASKS